MAIVKFLPIFLAIFAAHATPIRPEGDSGECIIFGSQILKVSDDGV
jgi:hypothetical protein